LAHHRAISPLLLGMAEKQMQLDLRLRDPSSNQNPTIPALSD